MACWACLRFAADIDTAAALGWAILPFSIIMPLVGIWADAARRETAKSDKQPDPGINHVSQKQRAGNNVRQIQVGGDLRINERER